MYKALLVSPDGDWVTDYRGYKTKEEVIECLENQGSRWIFYPYEFVIADDPSGLTATFTQRICDACPEYFFLKGKTIAKALDFIQADCDLSKV